MYIALITETHLTCDSDYNISDYSLYKTDRSEFCAVTTILILSDIQHYELPCVKEPHMQAIIICI